jgi:hypothetical protein
LACVLPVLRGTDSKDAIGCGGAWWNIAHDAPFESSFRRDDMNSQSAREGMGTNGPADSGNAEKLKGDAASAISSAREAASKFADSAKSTVDDYADAGAQKLKDAAGAVRGAADRVSSAMGDTSMSDLVDSIGAFAARRPVTFFGCGVLAGLVLARLLSGSER